MNGLLLSLAWKPPSGFIAHREPNYNLISPGPDTVVWLATRQTVRFPDTPLPVPCVALLFSESVRIHDYAFINQISDISHPVPLPAPRSDARRHCSVRLPVLVDLRGMANVTGSGGDFLSIQGWISMPSPSTKRNMR